MRCNIFIIQGAHAGLEGHYPSPNRGVETEQVTKEESERCTPHNPALAKKLMLTPNG